MRQQKPWMIVKVLVSPSQDFRPYSKSQDKPERRDLNELGTLYRFAIFFRSHFYSGEQNRNVNKERSQQMFPRLWTHLSGKESGHLSSSEKKKSPTEIIGQNVFEHFLPLFYKILGFLAQSLHIGKREEELPIIAGPADCAWTPPCLQVFLFQEEPGQNNPGLPSMLGSLSVSLKNLNKKRTWSVELGHPTSKSCPTAEQLDNFFH